MVTVIVPAFNRANYIKQTVESVFQQTYKNVELIVVDDGSSDGTREILERYSEERKLCLLQHPGGSNRGQAASINKGLEHARGEFVQILDSDDYLAEKKFEIEVAFLSKNPNYGLVYSNGHAVDTVGNVLYEIYGANHIEKNDPNSLLLDCYMLLPNNSLARRNVYTKAGFFETSFRAAQDHDMLLRIAEWTTMVYIPEHLFFYRRHDKSISATRQDVRWRTGFEILRRAKLRYPYKRSTVRRREAVLNFRLAQVYWRSHNYHRALPRMIAAALLDLPRAVRVILGIERVR